MAKTEIYDAQGEHMRVVKATSGPRNVPAHMMARLRAAGLQQLMGTEESPDFSVVSSAVLRWPDLPKGEKLAKVPDLEAGEVKALLATEDDDEILKQLLNRKRQITSSMDA